MNQKLSDGLDTRYVPTYARFDVRTWSANGIFEELTTAGLKNLHRPDTYHITTVFSKKPCYYRPKWVAYPVASPVDIGVLGDQLVLFVFSTTATDSWKHAVTTGASWDFSEYRPHISISDNIMQDIPLDIKSLGFFHRHINLMDEVAEHLIIS